MSKFLDSAAEGLGRFLNNLASINLWPYVIGLIVLGFGVSCFVQYMQIKQASRRFANGIFDKKTIRLCERIKRRSIFPQVAELHDLFCCILSAMYMEKGDLAHFFENLNSIKNVTEPVAQRLTFLLLAYLAGEGYQSTATAFRVLKTAGQSDEEIIMQKLQSCVCEDIHNRVSTLEEKITKQQVLNILYMLTDSEKATTDGNDSQPDN